MRISIVGNGGTGKTTLARKLASALKLPVFHTDTLLWRPDWEQAPIEEYDRAHAEVIGQDRWLLEGLGTWESTVLRTERSTAVVFTDYPLDLALRWAAQRIEAHRDVPRAELAEGCTEGKVALKMLGLIRKVQEELVPKLVSHLAALPRSVAVYRFRTPEETETFLRAAESTGTLGPPPPFEG